jgi:hypothetical protein
MYLVRVIAYFTLFSGLCSCKGHSEQSFYKMKELHSVLETDHKEIMEYYSVLKDKLDHHVEMLIKSNEIKDNLKANLIKEIEIMYNKHAEMLEAHENLMHHHQKVSEHADKELFHKMHGEHEAIRLEHEIIRSEMLEKLDELKILVHLPAK